MERICQIITLTCTLVSTVGGASTDACYGAQFLGTLCEWPSYIEVQSADYGITSAPNPSSCNLNEKVCRQDMREFDLIYYQRILDSCNGGQSCAADLKADWEEIPDCNDTLSQYVEIFYFCLFDGSTVTPPTSTVSVVTTTTFTTTTTPSTTTTSNSTDGGGDPGGGGLGGGAIAGIVIGVILVVALIGIIVMLVILCRRDPEFTSRAKTTVMKPLNMMRGDKKTERTNSSSSSGTTDTAPDILRHPHIHGYSKPKIHHQNVKMNRDTTCRSGFGPEIILTPQEAGANPPTAVNIQALHTPVPSIEIVSTPQEAIRRTRNNLPYSPELTIADEENAYEEFDDVYDEFNDQYDDEYAEISDFERNDNSSVPKKKKPSIKPKPKQNKTQLQSTPKPKQPTLNDEIMNHLQRRKDLLNTSGNNTARSSTLEMTENDDLYYNSGDVNQDYEDAAKVDADHADSDGDGSRYYDLQPKKNQMSRKYEQLRYSDNPESNRDGSAADGNPDARKQRRSRDIYSDDGEYYDDYDEWSTEGSTDDYMGDQDVRTSAMAIEDGHGNDYSRRISSTQC